MTSNAISIKVKAPLSGTSVEDAPNAVANATAQTRHRVSMLDCIASGDIVVADATHLLHPAVHPALQQASGMVNRPFAEGSNDTATATAVEEEARAATAKESRARIATEDLLQDTLKLLTGICDCDRVRFIAGHVRNKRRGLVRERDARMGDSMAAAHRPSMWLRTHTPRR